MNQSNCHLFRCVCVQANINLLIEGLRTDSIASIEVDEKDPFNGIAVIVDIFWAFGECSVAAFVD
jgi:hypothetical protein